MKKLLTILGSLSMASYFGIQIIACSTNNKGEDGIDKEPPTTEEEESLNKIIEKFKYEVSTIINKQVENTISNFFEHESNAMKNSFLKYDLLTKIENNNLTDQQKKDLKTDVKHLVDYKTIENEIQNLKNEAYYDSILKNVEKVLKDIEFDFHTLKIDFPKDSEKLKIISVRCDYKFVANYETRDHFIESYNVKNTMKYSQTSDTKIVGWWKNLVENLKNEVFEKAELTHLNANLLGIKQEKDDKFFNKSSKLLPNYVNTNTFSSQVLKYIDKNSLLEGQGVIKFKDNSNLYKEVEWVEELVANKTTDYNWKDNKEGQNLYDYIFRDKKSTDTKSVSGTQKTIDESLYNYINTNAPTWVDSHKQNTFDFLKKNNLKTDTDAVKSANKIGYIKLTGLQFHIGKNYIHDLPDFKLLTSYAIDEKEDIYQDNKTIENSKLFASIYFNSYNGVKSYKETFGIRETKNDLALSAFTGKNEKINKNFWDISKDFWANSNGIIYLDTKISKTFGLVLDELKAFKDYLLLNGNQNTYKWDFGNNAVSLKYDDGSKKGLYFKNYAYNPSLEGVPGGGAAGEESINILYQLDFVNLKFNSQEGWRYRPTTPGSITRNNTSVFEKVDN